MAALPQYDFYEEMMRRVPALRKQAEPGEAPAHAKISGRAAALRVGVSTPAASAVAGASRATSPPHEHLNGRSEFSSSSAGTFNVVSG
jgi:hypothetical protein